MSEIIDLLTKEVVPWIERTASIGVLAGATYAAIMSARAAWKSMPLVEHELRTSRNEAWTEWDAFLTVTVMNRAPARLHIEGIEVLDGHKTRIHENVGAIPFEKQAGWSGYRELKPYVPGADEFPLATSGFLLTWPDEGETVRLRVLLNAQNQWVLPWKRTFKIKLPAKIKPSTEK